MDFQYQTTCLQRFLNYRLTHSFSPHLPIFDIKSTILSQCNAMDSKNIQILGEKKIYVCEDILADVPNMQNRRFSNYRLTPIFDIKSIILSQCNALDTRSIHILGEKKLYVCEDILADVPNMQNRNVVST
jgi:hypothetical protein